MRLNRLTGALVAAALIVVGVVLAGRPVGDEGPRAHATDLAFGTVSATRTAWDGSQVLTVDWSTENGLQVEADIEDFNSYWQVGDLVGVKFNPDHPGTGAVLEDPTWTFAKDFRADAVFQAVALFTLAGIVLALAVIWPAGPWLFGESARRARRSLRGYVLVPAVLCGIVVTVAVAIQDQSLSAESIGADKIVGWLSVVMMLLLIWPYVRAVQYFRLRRLLTVADDAADHVTITSATGRRLELGPVRMVTLAGQRPGAFRTGDRVRLFGRWERRGPALITDGDKLLIGFAHRTGAGSQAGTSPVAPGHEYHAPADVIEEPLIRQHPQLAGKMPLLLVPPAIVLVIGIIGSIVIGVSAGANALGALPTLWIFILPLIVIPIRRYRRLGRLLRMPHVARHGVVASVTSNWRGATVPIIAMSVDRTVRLRLIGERQVPWLAEDQDVTLSQLPTPSVDAVVLATEHGHAALAIATTVQVQQATAAEPTV